LQTLEISKDDLLFEIALTLEVDGLLDIKLTCSPPILLFHSPPLSEEILAGIPELLILMVLKVLTLELERIYSLEEPLPDPII